MQRIVLALALVGGLWPALTVSDLALASVSTVDCSSDHCVSNERISAHSTDTFAGKCTKNNSPGLTNCKGVGAMVPCQNNLGGAKCSCTNNDSSAGYAEVTITCP